MHPPIRSQAQLKFENFFLRLDLRTNEKEKTFYPYIELDPLFQVSEKVIHYGTVSTTITDIGRYCMEIIQSYDTSKSGVGLLSRGNCHWFLWDLIREKLNVRPLTKMSDCITPGFLGAAFGSGLAAKLLVGLAASTALILLAGKGLLIILGLAAVILGSPLSFILCAPVFIGTGLVAILENLLLGLLCLSGAITVYAIVEYINENREKVAEWFSTYL